MKKAYIISLAIFIIGTTLIFKSLFTGTLSLGDAPYFYQEGLQELRSEPAAWVSRGINLGGLNSFLWISPLMMLFGHMKLDSDIILNLLFYIPSLLLSISGGWLLAKRLKLNTTVQIFTSFFLVLNTYYLLLIDGGQVGIALAYGLFPWVLIFIRQHLLTGKSLLGASIASLLLCLADPRVFILALTTITLWWLLENGKKNLQRLIPIIAIILALNLYWIIPLAKFSQSPTLSPSSLKLTSLLNGITLYQPNWSDNQFGKVTPPPFYLLALPVLILIGTNFKKRSSLVILLLILLFTFLLKGQTDPLGNIYNWFLNNIPLAGGFRDASKFFIPLMLLAGLAIGKGIEVLSGKIGSWVLPLSCILILLLVYQAPLGKLPMVLSGKSISSDYQLIYEKLRDDDGFFRTVWFPERHPRGFAINEKPALDAKSLVELSPLSFLNAGGDVLNFLNSNVYTDWLSLLGIKYLIVDKDPRRVETEDDQKARNELIALLSQNTNLEKTNWGTDIPVFRTKVYQPEAWGVQNLLAVVGDQSVYQTLEDLPGEFHPQNQAIAFFEDGKFDPKILNGTASQSATLVFDGKSKIDLSMSFLQRLFQDLSRVTNSQWALGLPSDYLAWKYELLIRNFVFEDFFYNKSIAYSSLANEKISISINVPADGVYHLAIRAISRQNEPPLTFSFANKKHEALKSNNDKFSWTIIENLNLKKGKSDVVITNNGGLKVLNTVALIPENQWQSAQKGTDVYLKHFPTVDLSIAKDKQLLADMVSKLRTQPLNISNKSQTSFHIQNNPNVWWIIYSNSYHPLWKIRKGNNFRPAVPAYSMLNAFYLDSKNQSNEIVFEGQETLRWGVYWTVLASLAIVVALLYRSLNGRASNN